MKFGADSAASVLTSFDVLMFCDAVNIVCYKNNLVLLMIDYTFKE